MAYENLLYEVDGPVAVLRVNRPDKLNALNTATLHELVAAFTQAGDDPQVQVAVITGVGRAFIAGADIGEMSKMRPQEGLAFARLGHRLGRTIELLRVPVIAAVNGFALGGGCELALACDLIHASTQAKLGQPEVKLGIIPGHGGTQRLMRRVGRAMAGEMIFSGRVYGAQEALRLGLVNAVHEPEALLPEVLKLAKEIAARGPVAVQVAKRLLRLGEGLPLEAANELEQTAFGNLFDTADQKEGMEAFLAKRDPQFTGR